MIIFGDEHISCKSFEKINSIDDIKCTSPNSVVCFGFDKAILKYCLKNNVESCVFIDSLTQAVYANALGASFVIPQNKIVQSVQKTAEEYLFDTKVLALIDDEKQIEELILKTIDGVVFKSFLK